MLLNLLATDNLVSYNIKVAKVFGLHSAIYIAELMNILEKANKKDKLVEDKYFVLDRKYITKRTTLDTEEQLAIDYKLAQLSIIVKPAGAVDTLWLDVDKLAATISSDDEAYLGKVAKRAQVKTTALPGIKMTMRQKKAEEMKSYITEVYPELREAYLNWVDAVYENPKGFLSKRAVELFQRDVDIFANGYLDIALSVVDIAIKGGYREASWAIEKFNKDYANQSRRRIVSPTDSSARNVPTAEEVF